MRSLFVFIRKIQTFLGTNSYNKLLLIEAAYLTCIARIATFLLPFKRYNKHIGSYKEETPYEIDAKDYSTIKGVAWAVNTISKYTPWQCKCLVQAIAAQRMLKKRKIYSTLYLGVNKNSGNEMKAHAWLRCGHVFVTGGYIKSEFREVARFGNGSAVKI